MDKWYKEGREFILRFSWEQSIKIRIKFEAYILKKIGVKVMSRKRKKETRITIQKETWKNKKEYRAWEITNLNKRNKLKNINTHTHTNEQTHMSIL